VEKKFLPFYVGILLLGIIVSIIANACFDVSAHSSIRSSVRLLAESAKAAGEENMDEARAAYLKEVIPDDAWFYLDLGGRGITGWQTQVTQLFDYFAAEIQSVDNVKIEYAYERLSALVRLDLTLKPGEDGKSRKVQRRIIFVQHHVRPTADGADRWIKWGPYKLVDEDAMVESTLKGNLKSLVPDSPKKKLTKTMGDYLKSYTRNHDIMKDALVKLYVDGKYTPFKRVLDSHTKTVLKKKELLDTPELISQINSLILFNFGNESLAAAAETWRYGQVLPKNPYVVKVRDGRAAVVRVRYAIPRHRNDTIKSWIRSELQKQALAKLEPLWPDFAGADKPVEAGQISIEDARRFDMVKGIVPRFVEDEKLRQEMIRKIGDIENGFKVRREDIVKTANETDESGKKTVLFEGAEFTKDNCLTIAECNRMLDELKNYESGIFRQDSVDELLYDWNALRKKEPDKPASEHFNRDEIRFRMLELIPEAAHARVVPVVQNIRGTVYKKIIGTVDRLGRTQNDHRKVMERTIDDRVKAALKRKICPNVTSKNLEGIEKWAREEHAEELSAEEKSAAGDFAKIIYEDLRNEMNIDPKKITNYEAEHYFIRNYYFVQRAVPGQGEGGKLTVEWFPVSRIESYRDVSGLKSIAEKALVRQEAARQEKEKPAPQK